MRFKWLTVVSILAVALLFSALGIEVAAPNKSLSKMLKLHPKRKVFFV